MWKWKHTPEKKPKPHNYDPASTPAWHDGKLYLFSFTSQVFCLDAATGKEVWKRDLIPARCGR